MENICVPLCNKNSDLCRKEFHEYFNNMKQYSEMLKREKEKKGYNCDLELGTKKRYESIFGEKYSKE